MWFKQIQIFQLADSFQYAPDALAEKLEQLAFTPCPPSFPSSIGWVTPFDSDEGPLVHGMNGYMMMCLQIEERILPSTVIRQALLEKVKAIEARDERRVRAKEKLSLKDEVILTLLPRAFTKLTRIYGYLDTKNNWLILGTTNTAKTEQFISLLHKATNIEVKSLELKKISPELTYWIKEQNYPTEFSVEKSCMLQDPGQQNRVIRCQHQDLFAISIQSLINDGCEVKQLAITWQDRVTFTLADDFSIRSVKYQDEILAQVKEMDVETKQQQFDADFFIMTEVLCQLLTDLIKLFTEQEEENLKKAVGFA